MTIASRCMDLKSATGGSCDPRVPCDAVLYSDGVQYGGCGEPCSWSMRKAGHGNPPFLAPSELVEALAAVFQRRARG